VCSFFWHAAYIVRLVTKIVEMLGFTSIISLLHFN